jgi:ribosomal protein L15E
MKKPVWKTKDPTKSDKKLTSSQKASAKAAAKKAGRSYPNLVDNMRAASKKK